MAKKIYLDTIVQNGIVYGITSNNVCFVHNGCSVPNTTVKIPEKIGGLTVVGIEEHAFANSNVKNIVLPKTVIVVENYAFYNALNLKTVTFEADTVKLGHKAFANCFRLQKIVGNKLSTLSDMAFSQCKNLVEIDADFIGEVFTKTFYLCKRLTALSFADNIKIHDGAFHSCMSIQTLHFVKNVSFSKQIQKFVEKRKIFCWEDCPLTDLAYTGADVTIKWE